MHRIRTLLKLIAQDKCLTVGIKNINNVIISVVTISVIAEGQESMEGACWCEKNKKKENKNKGVPLCCSGWILCFTEATSLS